MNLTEHKEAVVMAGTGRTGTTFLARILKHFGISKFEREVPEVGNSAFRVPIWNTYAPVIRAPWLTVELPDHDEVAHAIRCILLPHRDLAEVVESFHRRQASGPWPSYRENPCVEEFETRLEALKTWADSHLIPVVPIKFPEHTRDSMYLYNSLEPWLPLPDYEPFHEFHTALRTGPRIS